MLAQAQRAVEQYRELLEKDPTNLDYQARLAQAQSIIASGRDTLDAAFRMVQIELAMERESASCRDHYLWALLMLNAGDEARYRQTCATILDRYVKTSDATEANFAAWACTLADGGVDDYAPAIELAQRAVEQRSDDPQMLNTLGEALYHAGRWEEAREQLMRAVDAGEDPSTSPAYDWFFLAMTDLKLGNRDAALEWYARAAEYTDRALDKPDVPWNRRMTLRLLRQEAESMLEPLRQSPDDELVEAGAS